jgi:hypothetical protein
MRYGDSELHLERRIEKHSKQAEWRVLTRETEAVVDKVQPEKGPEMPF